MSGTKANSVWFEAECLLCKDVFDNDHTNQHARSKQNTWIMLLRISQLLHIQFPFLHSFYCALNKYRLCECRQTPAPTKEWEEKQGYSGGERRGKSRIRECSPPARWVLAPPLCGQLGDVNCKSWGDSNRCHINFNDSKIYKNQAIL